MSYPDFLKGGTGIVISGAKMLIDILVCGWNCLTPVQSPDFSLGTRSLRFLPLSQQEEEEQLQEPGPKSIRRGSTRSLKLDP